MIQMFEKSEEEKGVVNVLKGGYSGTPKNDDENAMIAIGSMINRFIGTESAENIAKEALKIVHRLFDFQFVSIALKGKDGIFRYVGQIGLTSGGEKTLFGIEYTEEQLFDESIYPSTTVSDITRFYMAENEPFKEEEIDTFGRPLKVRQKRMTPDEMVEGDYIDEYIRGWDNEIIGYIELSLTRSRQLPDSNTIAWLELIVSILGMIISRKT